MNIKKYIANETVKERIQETMQDKSQQFILSVLSLVNSNSKLAECEPASLLNACMTAAALELPINQNLGFAYIIPYNQKQQDGSYKSVAQFQMGYRGFLQLAQRSGQFKTINVSDVREGEITNMDRLTGEITFDWKSDRDKLAVVGYVGYIELVNGFSKTLYMTMDELKKHGQKFSKTAKKGYGLWIDEPDAMYKKTVIKLLLSKYAPLTVDMQKAQLADQAVIEDDKYKYVDNQPILPEEIAGEKEREKVLIHIENAQTIEDLMLCEEYVTDATKEAYTKKLKVLKKKHAEN